MSTPSTVYVVLDVDGEVCGVWSTVKELLETYDLDELVREKLTVAEYVFSSFGEIKTTFIPTTVTKPKKK